MKYQMPEIRIAWFHKAIRTDTASYPTAMERAKTKVNDELKLQQIDKVQTILELEL